MKAIKLVSCALCPHKDHSGNFTPGGAYPVCNLMERDRTDTRHVNYHGNRRVLLYVYAGPHGLRHPTYKIPDWCPLPDFPEGE